MLTKRKLAGKKATQGLYDELSRIDGGICRRRAMSRKTTQKKNVYPADSGGRRRQKKIKKTRCPDRHASHAGFKTIPLHFPHSYLRRQSPIPSSPWPFDPSASVCETLLPTSQAVTIMCSLYHHRLRPARSVSPTSPDPLRRTLFLPPASLREHKSSCLQAVPATFARLQTRSLTQFAPPSYSNHLTPSAPKSPPAPPVALGMQVCLILTSTLVVTLFSTELTAAPVSTIGTGAAVPASVTV